MNMNKPIIKNNILTGRWMSFAFLVLLFGFSACKQDKKKSQDALPPSRFSDLVSPSHVVNDDSIRQIIVTKYLTDRDLTSVDSAITTHYRDNGHLLWLGKGGIQQADSMLYWLETSSCHGLSPDYFSAEHTRKAIERIHALELEKGESMNHLFADLEFNLTKAYLTYICGMNYGFITPEKILNHLEEDDDPHNKVVNPPLGAKKKMRKLYDIPLRRCNQEFALQALDDLQEDAFAALRQVQPSSVLYKKLQKELARVNSLGEIEFENIPSIGDTLLKEGDSHPALPLIARRLKLTGELKSNVSDSTFMTLTPELMDAVNKFRSVNRLPDDNSIGTYTIRYLNRPLSDYRNCLRVNLERARWQYMQEKGSKYIQANVAAFMLQAVNEETDSILEMRICCGTVKNKTPLLTSKISYMELNPYWNVPQNIILKEMIPAYRRDTAYFAKNQLKVYDKEGTQLNPHDIKWSKYKTGVPYTVKQDNKKGNSLGRIIFRFPNAFSVYLHDTPSRWTFTRTNRAVSHGCVRLEKALDLAFFLLKEPDEKLEDRIRISMDIPPVTDAGKKLLQKDDFEEMTHYNLKERIPLFLDYQTIYLSADGSLSYCEDIYKYDAPLLLALDELTHK